MGSTKTYINVSSTTYNISGDYNPDNNYLAATIISGVYEGISGHEAIMQTLLNSPKVNYRNFLKWANSTNYPGNLNTKVVNRKSVNVNIVKQYLNTPTGQTCNIEKTFIKVGDIDYFAEQYLLKNNPTQVSTNWGVEYLGNNQVLIEYEDTTTEIFNLPLDFEYQAEYLYAYVKCYNDAFKEPLIEGALINDNNLPNTDNYSETNNIVTPLIVNLNTTIHNLIEYSDGRANEETTNVTTRQELFNTYVIQKEKKTYLGNTSGETIQNDWTYYTENLNYEIVEDVNVGVTNVNTDFGFLLENGSNILLENNNKILLETDTLTVTTTVTTTTENTQNNYSYQIDTQIENISSLQDHYLLIYKLGSGDPILDQLISTEENVEQDFFPIIPLRYHNISTRGNQSNHGIYWYEENKKAFKKSIGGDIDQLYDKIESNPQLGDIDHCYLQFGFSLNTKSNFEKEYIYEFFKEMIDYQNQTNADYVNWLNELYSDTQGIELYVNWFIAQSDINNPLYDTPKPMFKGARKPSETFLRLRTDNPPTVDGGTTDNFDIRIAWSNINESFYTGLGKSDANSGDFWISLDPPDINLTELTTLNSTQEIFARLVSLGLFTQDNLGLLENSYIYIYKQINDNNYSVISVSNLTHRNYIYREYYHVYTSSRDAILDEDQSAFIIPLMGSVLEKISFRSSNEMLLRAGNLTFNTLEITKSKWYEQSWFRVVVIVVLVVIVIIATIASGGTATGPTAKAAAFVVAALGIGGVLGVILTALLATALNIIIATLLSKILYLILKEFVDDRTAQLISMVATTIIMIGINTDFNFSDATDLLLRADNVIMLTSSFADYVLQSFYLNDIEDLQSDLNFLNTEKEKTENLIKEYTNELQLESDRLIQEVLKVAMLEETPKEFLNRTLMTSDDIINITMEMINRFTDINFDFD